MQSMLLKSHWIEINRMERSFLTSKIRMVKGISKLLHKKPHPSSDEWDFNFLQSDPYLLNPLVYSFNSSMLDSKVNASFN